MEPVLSEVEGLEMTRGCARAGCDARCGFSITMDEKEKVLRSVEKLKRGTHSRTRLADGELESQVRRVSSADSAG